MAKHEHNPFSYEPTRTRREKNAQILLEKARRGNAEAIRELKEIYGITFYRRGGDLNAGS